jgi:hypothetical protein
LLTSGFVRTADVVSALFGTETITFSADAPEQMKLDRRADGFWRFGHGFRGTRVSGVLIGNSIMPWTIAGTLPRLWMHPSAAHPLPTAFGLPTASVGPDIHLVLSDDDRTGADVFDLDPRWPGPESPFP